MTPYVIDHNDGKVIYYIDYEGCPMECTEEEYDAELKRLAEQCGGAK